MEQDNSERMVRLLSSYQEQLYRYVFALLPNEQDAKDVVQETCVALCRKFDEYDSDRPFLPWAFRFAHLEVLKHRQRRRAVAMPLSDDVIELLARERDAQNEALNARLIALEDCLRDLPRTDLELIRQRYHARMSIEMLAGHVEMSHRTLFRNLKRVRRVLFDCITRKLSVEGSL